MKPLLYFFLLTFTGNCIFAQGVPERHTRIDVIGYQYQLQISDLHDTLRGQAAIRLNMLRGDSILLDLHAPDASGKGMRVSEVTVDKQPVTFTQLAEWVAIPVATKGEHQIALQYKGIPADGLIISTNKYNRRCFFADNWPNRAHQWIPCNDHPSDKATVGFRVTAPAHYQVIANGIQTEECRNGSDTAVTEWQETTAIPSKVMVIGCAEFAVGYAGAVGQVPVTSWIFAPDRSKGFYDYSQATEILPWFIQKVGPYPFSKLANVQSKTIFGGMENAGCIFYYENSVTGNRKVETLLAHEIAHQWFGNSASEKHWSELWLSEGFATYMTDMYMESVHGIDTMRKMLQEQRKAVIDFYRKEPQRPIVDSLETDYMKLLNANSYPKAGWVLHMLRRQLGDSIFWKGIRDYYASYTGKNANTTDFMRVMEKNSGRNLETFFRQWLRTPGHPQLRIQWNTKGNNLQVHIRQMQKEISRFPLTIRVRGNGHESIQTIQVNSPDQQQHFALPFTATQIEIDPFTDLLAEWTTERVK